MCKHPCDELNKAYQWYQGQNPYSAKFIFIGKDANFSSDISTSRIFNEVLKYLADGVKYWRCKKRHHPFLSPLYEKGPGYKYHHSFSKMGLSFEYADKISFVELLDFPTCGNTTPPRLMTLLNVGHIKKLDDLLQSSTNKKAVYIARGAYPILYEIGKEKHCFKCLPEPQIAHKNEQRFERNKLYTVYDDKNLKVYVITHFSDAISNDHIVAINQTIGTTATF